MQTNISTVIKDTSKDKKIISVIFSLNTSSLVLPYHLLPKIKIEYQEMLDQGTCWIDSNQNVSSLFCSVSQSIPTLVIDFYQWRVTFPERILKSKSYFHYYKIMSFQQDQENLIFSLDLLKYFTLVFDKENSQVGFYNSQFVRYIGRGKIKIP